MSPGESGVMTNKKRVSYYYHPSCVRCFPLMRLASLALVVVDALWAAALGVAWIRWMIRPAAFILLIDFLLY